MGNVMINSHYIVPEHRDTYSKSVLRLINSIQIYNILKIKIAAKQPFNKNDNVGIFAL